MEDPAKNIDAIDNKKEDLKSIRERQLHEMLVRSRARWIEQRKTE